MDMECGDGRWARIRFRSAMLRVPALALSLALHASPAVADDGRRTAEDAVKLTVALSGAGWLTLAAGLLTIAIGFASLYWISRRWVGGPLIQICLLLFVSIGATFGAAWWGFSSLLIDEDPKCGGQAEICLGALPGARVDRALADPLAGTGNARPAMEAVNTMRSSGGHWWSVSAPWWGTGCAGILISVLVALLASQRGLDRKG